MPLNMLVFTILFAIGVVHAISLQHAKRTSCACGYEDSKGNIWREAIESDFTVDAGALSVVEENWHTQSWESAADPPTSPMNMQYEVANVYQYNDALGLKTSSYNGGGTTYTAEIDTQRSDILYGTFRMRAQIPSVPGVCFGFFSYKSDTQETDIEFLSSDTNYYEQVHYTNQPGTVDGNVDPNAAKDVIVSGADFTTFGEHRFDWLPTVSTFYYEGALTSTISKNVPSQASTIIANVWSNGGSWSQGPPTADAIATIQYIKMYFNSTSLTAAQFTTACENAGSPAICQI